MGNKKLQAALVIALFGLAAYTQLTQLTSVPGLHFDEAWQGNFANRIATEPGFRPTEAMNSYTTPIVHYLLALVFRAFGPSLEAMRGAYAAMNLGSLALLAALLWWLGERAAVAWFTLMWALLPLAVHDHRFHVEVTGFHSLCFAVLVWGLALWRRRPVLSPVLVAASIVAGTYSHVLFISVFAAGLFALARSFPAEFRSRRSQALITVVALLLIPLPVRMGLGLGKASPLALAGALACTAAWAALTPRWIRGYSLWQRWPRRAMRLSKLAFVCALPFLVGFVALLWNGPWPYAQATGHLDNVRWMPLNALIFLMLMAMQLNTRARTLFGGAHVDERRHDELRERYHLSPSLVWGAFVATFLVASILILKQSPRYYTVPTILAMIWASQRLARIHSRKAQLQIAVIFAAWNLWAFEHEYLARFEHSGSTTIEFTAGPYHDNGRDFRPFQKLFAWGLETGCLSRTPWVEDDRFGQPFRFLWLSSPGPKPDARCPWPPGDVFYSHITDYDPRVADASRNDSNTPPPGDAPNVKFLAHFPEWGDLAVWIRRKPR
ncbi:MAG: hypothetical protein HY075_03895 [Deltaproteobacteria bacterium]|nr:hypothetical protein [Deltaproteobacteria bacterium]